MHSWSRDRRRDCGRNDVVELGVIFVEIGFTLCGDQALVRTSAAGRAIAIFTVNFLDYVHAGSHFAEWCEALRVQGSVVLEIDEYLRGARVGAGSGKGDVPGLLLWVTGSSLIFAFSHTAFTAGSGVEAELNDESRDDAEEGLHR